MSELHSYGYICKNQDCKTARIIGDYLVDSGKGRLVNFPVFRPGKETCRDCKQSFEYTEADLVDFGQSGSVPFSNFPA